LKRQPAAGEPLPAWESQTSFNQSQRLDNRAAARPPQVSDLPCPGKFSVRRAFSSQLPFSLPFFRILIFRDQKTRAFRERYPETKQSVQSEVLPFLSAPSGQNLRHTICFKLTWLHKRGSPNKDPPKRRTPEAGRFRPTTTHPARPE